MNMIHSFKYLLPMVVFSLISSRVDAQIISVNFPGNTAQTLLSSNSAGVVSAINWNNATAVNSGTISNLLDNTGATTATSISFTGFGTYRVSSTTPSSSDAKMFNGYLNGQSWGGAGAGYAPLTIELTNITYSNYDVYVYFTADAAGRGGWISSGTVTYSSGVFQSTTGTAYGVISNPTASTAGTYVQGTNTTIVGNNNTLIAATYTSSNYVVFSNQTGSTFDLTMASQGTPFGISGIQLVAIPETPTMVYLICGFLTLTGAMLFQSPKPSALARTM